MSNAERPIDPARTERLHSDRFVSDDASRPRMQTASLADSQARARAATEAARRASAYSSAPAALSARAAAAQFDLAAILETPQAASGDRALVAPMRRPTTDLTTRPATSDGVVKMEETSKTRSARDGGRLPSAWYKQAEEIAEATRQERTALLIRGSAAACLATGAALLLWLGVFGGRAPSEPPSFAANYAPARRPSVASFAPFETPMPAAIEPNARALVTTAQILAVAERFIATGDILAARAMLTDTAAAGDPRALFALAETYDPNLLASWSAGNIDPSPSYARLLYDAALRAGMPDAQTRLDALK